MTFMKLPVAMVFLVSTLMLAPTGEAREKPPEIDNHGLHLVHHSDLRLVYTLPDTDFSVYDKAILVDAYVAFKKNWKREHNDGLTRITNQEMEKIKGRVADEFRTVFTAELEKQGIPVVAQTETGDDVLIIRPAIINLDIEAPDPMSQVSNVQVVAPSAGQMTLYAEIYDSVSSQMIAKVLDPEADRGFGGMAMQQNQVTNKTAEDRIVKMWAETMAKHMNAAIGR
jgi:hypothetical protein